MLGIDVSKKELTCTLLDPATRAVVWRNTVQNSETGFAQLVRDTPSDTAWVLEPTGRYGRNMVKRARSAGRIVLMAPTRKAKLFLASRSTRAKTDELDSRGLAEFGLENRNLLKPYPIESDLVVQVRELLSARKGFSRCIAMLTLQEDELPGAGPHLLEAIRALKVQREAVDAEIVTLTKNAPEFEAARRLRAVPGVGPVTSVSVAACLSSKQFDRPAQFVAYIGLDVRVRESGTFRGKRKLTHEGNAELRRLLYLCAQSSLKTKDSPFKLQYDREIAKGLPTTAAIVAVARKMAILCWALHRTGTEYDKDRVYTQPTTPPKSRQTIEEVQDSQAADPPLE